MDDNGVEDLSHLGGSGGTIQLALDALKQKKGSVDQVTSSMGAAERWLEHWTGACFPAYLPNAR